MKNKNNNNSDFFENPFLKEYLFNLQVNQKISIQEFLFTKNSMILIAITAFLVWSNYESEKAIRYIIIAFVLIFLYFFKNNNITKKAKYFVPKHTGEKVDNQLILHSMYNKKIKSVLKQKVLFLLLAIYFPQFSYSQFINDINQSTNTQIKNNNIYKEENDEMVKRAKIKNILYLSQEKKNFLTKQINEQIKIESDLEINAVKTQTEKSKNEIRK